MVSVSVLSLSDLILSILLKGSAIFNALWWLLFSVPIFFFFSMFQCLLHNLFLFSNSFICLLCRTLIYVWYFYKRAIYIFDFISAVAVYHSLEQAFCYLLYRFFVIHWFWWLLPESTVESCPFLIKMVLSVNANPTLRLATVDALAVFSPSLSYI